MQLLLLLSALLTSLTGAMAGARTADMQRVEASAGIAQAMAEAAVSPARAVQAIAASVPVLARDERPTPSLTVAPLPAGGRHERLLE